MKAKCVCRKVSTSDLFTIRHICRFPNVKATCLLIGPAQRKSELPSIYRSGELQSGRGCPMKLSPYSPTEAKRVWCSLS